MGILDHIRNIVNGTTRDLQKTVPGRKTFMFSFVITFGIIQLLSTFIVLYVYHFLMNPESEGFMTLFEDPTLFQFIFYLGFTGPIIVIFLAHFIWQNGGSQAKSLNFGASFAKFPTKALVIYALSVLFTLGVAVYFAQGTRYGINNYVSENPLEAFLSQDVLYVSLFRELFFLLIRFFPAIVVGYYLVYLKEGNWQASYFLRYWKQVVALIIVWMSFLTFYDYAWVVFSGTFMGILTVPFEEIYIPIVFNVVAFVFVTTFGYYVSGYIIYYSIFTWEDKPNASENISINEELIDQT